MRKTQSKDTIGKVILCSLLLLLGEGLFGLSLFWPVILVLVVTTRRTYFFGLLLGLALSVMTGTTLGLASLLIVGGLFVFERWRGALRDNVWLTGLVAVLFAGSVDLILGLSWSLLDGLLNFGLTYLIWKLGYFADEVHLTGR